MSLNAQKIAGFGSGFGGVFSSGTGGGVPDCFAERRDFFALGSFTRGVFSFLPADFLTFFSDFFAGVIFFAGVFLGAGFFNFNFLAGATVFFAVNFFAGDFFTGVFFAGADFLEIFAGGFFTAFGSGFLTGAAGFFAGVFFTGGFFAGAFLTGGFFAGGFFTGVFFAGGDFFEIFASGFFFAAGAIFLETADFLFAFFWAGIGFFVLMAAKDECLF